MYRCNVEHAVTYTPDDVVLFRESPFAVWMERLTLENPDHGIPADLDSTEPHEGAERRDDIVATLRAEGRNVVLIDWDLEEPERRTATLAAMRGGADFIVNGHLAVGTLSGKSNLLMRTSGYSDLGDFLYIPCETLSANTFQSAFRLCFTADLLHSLQGQLPPQMLIIRDGAEVVPLQTEDYIYYYRAVLQRFMLAMDSFRKHRMPDPAESAHFGRWSECASEVLKQRALGEQQRAEEQQAEESQEQELQEEAVMEMPQLRVASGSGAMRSHYDVDAVGHAGTAAGNPMSTTLPESTTAHRGAVGPTLAEQARLLAPDSYRSGTAPGHTPNLARFGRPRAVTAVPDIRDKAHNRRSSDAALQNLEFIGSNATETLSNIEAPSGLTAAVRPAPPPNLRETPTPEVRVPEAVVTTSPVGLPELEPRPPVFLPPDRKPVAEPPHERLKLDPQDSDDVKSGASSVIDMDSAPPPTLAPVVQRAEAEFARIGLKDPVFRRVDQPRPQPQSEENSPAAIPFSNSLITSRELNDC
jgi:hypothetical protein